jgi:protein-S-isoprenylcysteine O-methyltransferase Ste14
MADSTEAAEHPSASQVRAAPKEEQATDRDDDSGVTASEQRKLASTTTRAFARYFVISCVFCSAYVIYNRHPYYMRDMFAAWRPVFRGVFLLWLTCGFFYVNAVLEKFGKKRYWMTDSGLLYLVIVRGLMRKFIGPKPFGNPRVVVALVGAGIAAATGGVAWDWRGAIGAGAVGLVAGWIAGANARRLPGRAPTKYVFWNRRTRTAVLSLCVKGFFTPLMATFLSTHVHSIANAWLDKRGLPRMLFAPNTPVAEWFHTLATRGPELLPSKENLIGLVSVTEWTKRDIKWALDLAYDCVFFVDVSVATFGYMAESRFLGNKTRSVEPTGFGWLVAIGCYPPFNGVLGTYLPLNPGPQHFTGDVIPLVFKAITVALFSIYSAATVAFGFKFSNLTNRGIVSRGPYAFLRHPAYVCKCLAWWLEHIPTLTIESALFLCGTCSVYALRAWTEERHLSMDPDYIAYKKKVPWVMFPKVF